MTGRRIAAWMTTIVCAVTSLTAPSIAAEHPHPLGEGMPLGPGPAKENSGIVKSRNWPDLFWMHNDSGDEPRIYPVHRDGSVYQSVRQPETPGVLIGGAVNVDWEDIAVDASGHVIVADTGNGDNNRRDLVLYYVQEPSPDAEQTVHLRKIFVQYPEQHAYPAPEDDLNYDAEGIFTLGDIVYICTKHRSDTKTSIYRLDPDADFDKPVPMTLIDELDIRGQVTGADATASGDRLVLLTYNAVWLFEKPDPEHPVSGPARWFQYDKASLDGDDSEPEAVCFADDDTVLVGDEDSGRLYEVQIADFVDVPPLASDSAQAGGEGQ